MPICTRSALCPIADHNRNSILGSCKRALGREFALGTDTNEMRREQRVRPLQRSSVRLRLQWRSPGKQYEGQRCTLHELGHQSPKVSQASACRADRHRPVSILGAKGSDGLCVTGVRSTRLGEGLLCRDVHCGFLGQRKKHADTVNANVAGFTGSALGHLSILAVTRPRIGTSE